MKKVVYGLLLLVAVVVAADAYGMANKVESVADKMAVSLSIAKKGHGAVLAITVLNTSKNKIELVFPSSNTNDFLIKDQAGKVVWQWTKDRLFKEKQKRVSVDPGKSVVYSVNWDFTDLEGKDIAAATYKVSGILPVIPTAIPTDTKPIEVLDEDLRIAGGYIITGQIAVREGKVFINSDDGISYLLVDDTNIFRKLGGKFIRVFAPVIESIPNSPDKKITVDNYKLYDAKPVD